MKITTKGEYALRAIFDLLVSLKKSSVIRIEDIAARQNIPAPYLEHIFQKLRKAKIVASQKGPGGGYNLLKSKEEITIGEVLKAVGEKHLVPSRAKTSTTIEADKTAKLMAAGELVVSKFLQRNIGEF
jgi:Rrf2 family protein